MDDPKHFQIRYKDVSCNEYGRYVFVQLEVGMSNRQIGLPEVEVFLDVQSVSPM
jgi:hypothetical protein